MNVNVQQIIRLFFLFFAGPLPSFAQSTKGFTIDGHLEGLQNGEKVFLARYTDVDVIKKRSATIFDSCIVGTDGKFHLKAIAPEGGPYTYILDFDHSVRHRKRDEKSGKDIGGGGMELLVDNGQSVKIYGGDINKMDRSIFTNEVIVEGSPTQSALASLYAVDDVAIGTISQINRAIKKLSDTAGFDKSRLEVFLYAKEIVYDQLRYVFLGRGVKEYFKPAVPLIMNDIDFYLNDHPALVMDVYNSLDEKAKSSEIGKELKKRALLAIGQPLPSFTLPTPEGKLVSLKEIVAKGKFTIVHFWGSAIANDYADWLNQGQQELRMAYKKYHDRGLNIIGVSADSVDYVWKGFVQKQNYPWVNVSDLKGNLKGGMVNDVYLEGGHSVPNMTNVLLDGEGKILAWDPQGIVLQWYLSKYLGD